ncbi:MAG: GH1 family beta-glucosidase [Verrucomicrobia bacterium]|nr:GH1 family beta-glucosidase [Verrucomicrobiota bacterium]
MNKISTPSDSASKLNGQWNRRTFLASTAGLTAALATGQARGATPVAAKTKSSPTPAGELKFPRDFMWGVATAAYQIEGAANEDGRKPSVWDTFSRIPGNTANGDTGDVACDHYHRFEEDVKLMVELGVRHYRFSIAWPRIVPDGRGAVNEKGVDFYRRLADALLKHGITPHATLFHWDSPQALEDRYGSWRSREMAKDFADYCTATVQRLGDRITHWMTLNEIPCFTYLGYGVEKMPFFAPGTIVKTKQEVLQTVHHALLAHGLGCQAIRAAAPKTCRITAVANFDAVIPVTETAEDIAAAKRAFVADKYVGTTVMPMLTGRYSPETLATLGADAPKVQVGDLKTIAQPLDCLGYNGYTGQYVRAAANESGYELLKLPKDYPNIGPSWLKFTPEALYWGVRMISDALGKKDLPMCITENGCATEDTVNERGEVVDLTRIMFLKAYLRNAQRAVDEGYPLKGYFHWSLMDNFEWASAFTMRFGLTHVDYATQKRIPKQSFRWYQQLIRQNR